MTPPRDAHDIIGRLQGRPTNRQYRETGLAGRMDAEGFIAIARNYAIGQDRATQDALAATSAGYTQTSFVYDFQLYDRRTTYERLKAAIASAPRTTF